MEQMGTIMELVHNGTWLASIDISQAYHSLEIREADLLQFIHKVERYRFWVLTAQWFELGSKNLHKDYENSHEPS